MDTNTLIDKAIEDMKDFTYFMGLSGLTNEGLPALWQDGDHEFEVTRGPKIEVTVFDEIGDAIARVIGEIEYDNAIDHITIYTY
jgi:hypothetical protein